MEKAKKVLWELVCQLFWSAVGQLGWYVVVAGLACSAAVLVYVVAREEIRRRRDTQAPDWRACGNIHMPDHVLLWDVVSRLPRKVVEEKAPPTQLVRVVVIGGLKIEGKV